MTSVSVIGLGKLGAPLAACLASKGLKVIGVDSDQRTVEALNHGRPPVFEPGLEELIRASQEKITATTDIAQAVLDTEATFIVVATPSEPGGGFSLRDVLPVCDAIGRTLARKNSFHLIVLTSTVMPGTTGGVVRLALEESSGKSVGVDFGLCYSPEFVALGSVIHDFLNPDFVLIGESDPRAGALLESLYRMVCDKLPTAARMNFVNAEIAKLSVNTFVTTKISFANMLARICERLPEADVDVVTSALGLDSRIGAKYLKGAISYGGPCFPRDNQALACLAQQVEAPADIAQATDRFNRSQIRWLASLVEQHTGREGIAGILGLSYKPNSDVIEEAPGLLLAQELLDKKVSVIAFDPLANGRASRALDGKARIAATPQECITQSDVIVLATPWKEFLAIPAESWSRAETPRIVVDCWRALKYLKELPGIRYISLGIGEFVAPASMARAL